MKKKFYVVWNGTEPGIYPTWEECRRQTRGVKGAVFKAFDTESEAEEAFYSAPADYIRQNANGGGAGIAPPAGGVLPAQDTAFRQPAAHEDAIAVDAACSGNPGRMEYRGVDLLTGKEIFHFGPVYGTNNIGEFLAIVHALALLKKERQTRAVYSDSHNALLWVSKKACRTKLPQTPQTERVFSLIARAELWLRNNDFNDIPLKKGDTKLRGEIPADFGRK